MKVCFDACVVVDILGATDDLEDSFSAYDITCLKDWEPCVCTSTMGIIVYMLAARKLKPRAQARGAAGDIGELFDVIDLTAADCAAAYESSMANCEDALVAVSAKRAGVDLIVTRNKRDFAKSPVSAMTPREFVEAYKPADYRYSLVEL